MTRQFLINDWVTIRTRIVAPTIRQRPDLWLDLEAFTDVHAWNDSPLLDDEGDDDGYDDPLEVPPPPRDRFDDTIGLVYDDDAAAYFLQVTTSIACDVVESS